MIMGFRTGECQNEGRLEECIGCDWEDSLGADLIGGFLADVDVMVVGLAFYHEWAIGPTAEDRMSKTESLNGCIDIVSPQSRLRVPLLRLVGETMTPDGFPDQVSARFQNAAFTNDLVLALEHQRIFSNGPAQHE